MAGGLWHTPHDPPARCGLRELCQGSIRRVRQYSFMETRFLMETQFTFDEISHSFNKGFARGIQHLDFSESPTSAQRCQPCTARWLQGSSLSLSWVHGPTAGCLALGSSAMMAPSHLIAFVLSLCSLASSWFNDKAKQRRS